MPADQGLIDSVANDNTKAIAGKTAAVAAESFQQWVAHQGRLNNIAETALQMFTLRAHEMDPQQALSLLEGFKASDPLGEVLSKLGSVIAALQQITKQAQTTPPQTGTGGSGPTA